MKDCSYCHASIEEALEICPRCNNTKAEVIPEKKYVPTFSIRELFLLLATGTFLGVAHNYLMYGLNNGISIPLFAILFLSSLYGVARKLNIPVNRNMLVVGALLLVFSAFKAVRTGSMLTSYNTIAIYFT